MYGFQILNSNGVSISINELDKEACEFWGVKLHPKHYASPENERINWYDSIGWNISITEKPTWRKVIKSLVYDSFFDGLVVEDKESKQNHFAKFLVTGQNEEGENILHLQDDTEIQIYITMQVHQKYIDLINHWTSKGYQPKQMLSDQL